MMTTLNVKEKRKKKKHKKHAEAMQKEQERGAPEPKKPMQSPAKAA